MITVFDDVLCNNTESQTWETLFGSQPVYIRQSMVF